MTANPKRTVTVAVQRVNSHADEECPGPAFTSGAQYWAGAQVMS